jgi:hypothetical protein
VMSLTAMIRENSQSIAAFAGWVAKAATVLLEMFVESIAETVREITELRLALVALDVYIGIPFKKFSAMLWEFVLIPLAEFEDKHKWLFGGSGIDVSKARAELAALKREIAFEEDPRTIERRVREIVQPLSAGRKPKMGGLPLATTTDETGFTPKEKKDARDKDKKDDDDNFKERVAAMKDAAKAGQTYLDQLISASTKASTAATDHTKERLTHAIDYWKQQHSVMLEIASETADNIGDVFDNAFSIMLKGLSSVGIGFIAIFTGIGAAVANAIANVAKSHARQEFAYVIEETALGFGSLAIGNAVGASGHFTSAKTHGLAGIAWAALGGATAAVGGAAGGFGGSSRSDAGSRVAQSSMKSGPSVYLYVDGINPQNSRHVKLLGETVRKWDRRYGRVL